MGIGRRFINGYVYGMIGRQVYDSYRIRKAQKQYVDQNHQVYQNNQPVEVVDIPNKKSRSLSVLLTLLFGSFGLFYTYPILAVVMFLFNSLVFIVTTGIGIIFTRPLMMGIGYISAVSRNKSEMKKLINEN